MLAMTACVPVMGMVYSPSYPGSNAEYKGDYTTCSGRQIGPDNIVTILAGNGVTISSGIRHTKEQGNTLFISMEVPPSASAQFESNEIHFFIPPEGEKWTSKVNLFDIVFEGHSLSQKRGVDFLEPINKGIKKRFVSAGVSLSIYHYYEETIIVQLPNIIINGVKMTLEPITFRLKPLFGVVTIGNC